MQLALYEQLLVQPAAEAYALSRGLRIAITPDG
jgi:hypothetical protein